MTLLSFFKKMTGRHSVLSAGDTHCALTKTESYWVSILIGSALFLLGTSGVATWLFIKAGVIQTTDDTQAAIEISTINRQELLDILDVYDQKRLQYERLKQKAPRI